LYQRARGGRYSDPPPNVLHASIIHEEEFSDVLDLQVFFNVLQSFSQGVFDDVLYWRLFVREDLDRKYRLNKSQVIGAVTANILMSVSQTPHDFMKSVDKIGTEREDNSDRMENCEAGSMPNYRGTAGNH
jgi:hypothetical protein